MDYRNYHSLPKDPLLKQAVQDIFEHLDETALDIRLRTASLLYSFCRHADRDFLCAVLLEGLLKDHEVCEDYNLEILDYMRDLRIFYQHSPGTILRAAPLLKAHHLAVELATLQRLIDVYEGDFARDPQTPTDDIEDGATFLEIAMLDIKDIPYDALIVDYEETLNYVETLIEIAADAPRFHLPTGHANINAWVKNNGKKLF